MSSIKILDSFALLSFLEDGVGAEVVKNLFIKSEEKKIKLFIASITLGEVWYAIAKVSSTETADQLIQKTLGMKIEIIDADWQLSRIAANYHIKKGISYVKGFSAALAKQRKGELVTGDIDFQCCENELKIQWICDN